MILEALINIFRAIALFIIGLIPQLHWVGNWMNTSLDPLFDVILSANMFINVPVMVGCFLSIIVVSNAQFLWSLLMWAIRKIPGVN